MNQPSQKSQNFILYGMLAGIVAGVFCGWFFGEAMVSVKFLGTLFINALKAVIVPLIMASMICGVASLGDVRRIGRMGGYTILFYSATTFIAVLIGLIVCTTFSPGTGVDLSGSATPEFIEGHEFHFMDLVLKLVPQNIVASMAALDVLPLITSSLLLGGVLTTLGEKGKPLLAFFDSLNEAMMKVIHLIMFYAPVGIFGLIAGLLGERGGGDAALAELTKIGMFVITVVVGLFIHGFFVIPVVIKILAKRSPLEFAKNMSSAFTTAFSTDSSAATMPVTIDCLIHKNKVSERTTSFVIPLGATINMDGTALYEACAAIFVAQAVGLDLTMNHYIIVFLTSALASVGAAAIPHAGLVTMMMVFTALGLPLEAIGLIYSVDWFLDRCRTTVNVWGDASGAAVLDRLVPVEAKPAE